MNKLLFSIACLLFSSTWIYAEDDIKVKSTIEKVTVYKSNAKITRTSKTDIPAGKSEIILEKLSSGLLMNSIQVKIDNKNVSLISAVPRMNYIEQTEMSKRYKAVLDSLKIMDEKLKRLDIEISALKVRRSVMINNNPLGSAKDQGFTIDEIQKLMDFREKQVLEIDNKNLDLRYQKQDLSRIRQRLNSQIYYLKNSRQKESGEIVLKLYSKTAVNTDIEVSFVVANAGWTPMYDLRTEGIEQPVKLAYKANVYQKTGYDWKNVKLTLSTSDPNQNHDRPILNPLYVDLMPEQPKYKKGNTYIQYQGSGNVTLRDRAKKSYNQSTNEIDRANAPTNLYGAYRGGNIYGESDFMMSDTASIFYHDADGIPDFPDSDDGNTLEFELEMDQNIPSDGEQHIVIIKEHELDAVYEYHAVPKLDKGAFLLAKITDYGKYDLLPGAANIFYEGSYLGQSHINPYITTDTMLLSLGRDEKISIKREKLTDLTSKKVIGANKKETIVYEITVRNNKSKEINIDVLDQIPISKQENVEVTLESDDNADYHEPYGALRWKMKVPAGKTKKVRFKYVIKYPKNRELKFNCD
ncbi:MAG: DUF4139 domain-containing protein [Saprospiraceae bacterium]|nr:DUF4139 domain-containing protein [Saprospiraceae bacterium]